MTHLSHILPITLLALVTALDATSVDTVTAPSWLTSPPTQPGYLVGVAHARISDSPSAAENEALASALSQLAAQLSIDVVGATKLQRHESAQVWEDEFFSDLRTASAVRLEGVEVVDRYNDGERLWVYVRLHEASLRQKWERRAADHAAHLNQQLGQLRDAATPEATALRAGTLAWVATESGKLADGGSSLDRHTERQQVLAELCQRLADLELRPYRDGRTIGVDVRRHGGQAMLAGLPLRLRAGDRELLLWTDTSGRVRTPISAFDVAPPMTVTAHLDLQALVGTSRATSMITDLPLPSTRISVTQRARRVVLTGQERYFGQPAQLQHLRAGVADILRIAGVDITQDRSAAQQIIDIDAHAYRGTRVGDLAFAWLDLSITVTDARTGIVLFRGHRRDIKGAGSDHDGAVAAALRQATGLVREAVFTSNERDTAHVDSMGASLHP